MFLQDFLLSISPIFTFSDFICNRPAGPQQFIDIAPDTPPVSTVPDSNWMQIASDPAGDNVTGVDILGLYSKIASGNVSLRIETAGIASPASLGAQILFDTDQNNTTGLLASLYGCEYAVFIMSPYGAPACVATVSRLSDNTVVGEAPVTCSDNRVIIDIPLSLIDDDGLLNVTTVIGESNEAEFRFSDMVPNPAWATSGNPPPPLPPIESYWLEVTNVRDTSFAVAFVTTAPCTSGLVYGDNQSSFSSNVSDNHSSYLHYFTLSNLIPSRTYYFDILYGTNIDNNSGAHYSVTTGPTLDIPSTDDIVGRVYME